jgi:fumarylacetoacetate (FAA) hydrolase
MRLITFTDGGPPRLGLLVGGLAVELPAAQRALGIGGSPLPGALLDLLAAEEDAWETARRVDAALEERLTAATELSVPLYSVSPCLRGEVFPSLPTVGDVRLLPPVPCPGAFLDFYAFEEHVRNARARRGLEVPPEWYRLPAYYNGNARSLIGHGESVSFPPGETRMDYELELGVILRRGGRHLTDAEAVACIAGYTIVNDWSARALQREAMAVGLGPSPGKDFATSAGPVLLTPDELLTDRFTAPGHPALEMTARINGVEWSRGNSGAAHYTFPQMIAFASRCRALAPGDLIGSGTVGTGCGLELDRFLAAGDQVELEIEAIGTLTNRVAGEAQGATPKAQR